MAGLGWDGWGRGEGILKLANGSRIRFSNLLPGTEFSADVHAEFFRLNREELRRTRFKRFWTHLREAFRCLIRG